MEKRAGIPMLVAMMLLTGACNTLLTKYQDLQCVADCDSAHPKLFEQPVIQTLQMFVGEAGCWLVVLLSITFKALRKRTVRFPGADYQPLNNDEQAAGQGEEEEELNASLSTSQTLVDPTNIVPKPLIDGEEAAERQALAGWKIMLLAIPAIFDIMATTLMNVGLLFVAPSIYQMTRGAMVLFVGLFSVLFLKRRLNGWKWASLFIVVLGVAVVGLAGALDKKGHGLLPGDSTPEDAMALIQRAAMTIRDGLTTMEAHTAAETVVGILMIAVAQVFGAGQFVVEESIMQHYSMEPIQVVGWEGVFGFLVTLLAMGILHGAVGQTAAGQGGYFDARAAFSQVFTNRIVAITSILIMISIGGFNFFGLSVTRSLSSTSRSTIDTCRTLIIWLVSLGLGWETFKWLQVLGFALLVYGTSLFNDIVRPPTVAFLRRRQRSVALEE